ncbi:MAG: membrane dipeptidase, partial [Clostridia bacterium]|nr:membrane dipeptidase [Clostridia bacterium]
IMDIAEKYSSPVIASHSNSRSYFDHTRNLYIEQIKRLISLGGIIGHSLCPWHLADNGNADVDNVIDNIESLINAVGEDNICFGCDLDGTDLPYGFKDITSLENICNQLSHRFSPQIADKIQFTNALTKFQQFLK